MVKITYLGHSSFYIEGEKTSVLFDPFIENPLSIEKELVEQFKKLNPEYLLITHGHSDHLGQALYFIEKGSKVITIFEIFNYLRKLNSKTQGISMNIGGTVNSGNLKVTLVNATHSSSIMENDEIIYLGEPTGIIIELDNLKIYHMGDTGLTKDFELIGELYKPDIVLIPIGSIFTMGIKEAIKALEMIKPKIAIPMHYNTFPIIKQNPHKFKEEVEKKLNIKIEIIDIGETKIF